MKLGMKITMINYVFHDLKKIIKKFGGKYDKLSFELLKVHQIPDI